MIYVYDCNVYKMSCEIKNELSDLVLELSDVRPAYFSSVAHSGTDRSIQVVI